MISLRKLTWLIRVIFEMLIGSGLVKKLPVVYGTQRVIFVFATGRQLTLSWAIWIRSTPCHPLSLRSVSILSCHHRGYHSRSKGFRTKTLCAFVSLPSACYMPHPSHPPWFDQGVPIVITAAKFRFTEKKEIFRQAEVQSASQEGLHWKEVYSI